MYKNKHQIYQLNGVLKNIETFVTSTPKPNSVYLTPHKFVHSSLMCLALQFMLVFLFYSR